LNFGTSPPGAAGPPREEDVAAWVALVALPGIGPRAIAGWVDRAGSAARAWRCLPDLIGERADREQVLAVWRSLHPASALAAARDLGMTVVTIRDPGYPPLLQAVADAPPILFVKGTLDDAAAVAIVGSRRATAYGLAVAGRLAFDLASAGVVVVSGLARGIDGAAHRAALDGGGRTIAVLGSGLDIIYPPEHRRLAEAVAAQGALVSEFPPGTPPLPSHFPRRNRVISGLSKAVVLVEGARDSGALVTAECALDQGREVFAVPGSIFSEHSRAPHGLLRDGARMAETADDILRDLGLPALAGPSATGESTEASAEARVLRLLEAGPRTLDDLAAASGLAAGEVAAAVTALEIRGLIRMLPGQMVMQAVLRGRGRGGPQGHAGDRA
jgi:DNA processing protein